MTETADEPSASATQSRACFMQSSAMRDRQDKDRDLDRMIWHLAAELVEGELDVAAGMVEQIAGRDQIERAVTWERITRAARAILLAKTGQ